MMPTKKYNFMAIAILLLLVAASATTSKTDRALRNTDVGGPGGLRRLSKKGSGYKSKKESSGKRSKKSGSKKSSKAKKSSEDTARSKKSSKKESSSEDSFDTEVDDLEYSDEAEVEEEEEDSSPSKKSSSVDDDDDDDDDDKDDGFICLSKTSGTWMDHQGIAEAEGGNLISVTSKYIQCAVATLCDDYDGADGDCWIGGNDKEEEGTFVWVETEETIASGGYTNYAFDEPDDKGKGEDCLLLRTMSPFVGGWCDLPCNEPMMWMKPAVYAVSEDLSVGDPDVYTCRTFPTDSEECDGPFVGELEV